VGRFIYTKYWEIGKYLMLSTVGRYIDTKYYEILSVEDCGKIYLHKILENTLCCTLLKIYLHKILGNISC
jgi:hypothetical protein